MKKLHILIAFVSCCAFIACSKDEPSGKSIFPDVVQNKGPLDEWIHNNYEVPYNIDLIYRWDEMESDSRFNLIPAKEEKVREMVVVVKHLFMESYDEATGSTEFMRQLVPKVLMLIGSPAIDDDGSMVMGTAEGGIKVSLYLVNSLDRNNVELLNTRYFRTMHHEFAHIMNQKKDYDIAAWNKISAGLYFMTAWGQYGEQEAWDNGFATNYAGSAPEEDFVEIIANYIIRPDGWWDNMVESASDFGKKAFAQKLAIVKKWMMDSYNIDLDNLRRIIQRRQSEINDLELAPPISQ